MREKYVDQSKVDKYLLLNIELKYPYFSYILTLHILNLIFNLKSDCQKLSSWPQEKQWLLSSTFILQVGWYTNWFMFNKDYEPLSNKLWTLLWISAFSAVAITVWNKIVFGEELKFFICRIIITRREVFKNLSVLFNHSKTTYGKVMLFRTLIIFNFAKKSSLKYVWSLNKRSSASYLAIFLCMSSVEIINISLTILVTFAIWV